MTVFKLAKKFLENISLPTWEENPRETSNIAVKEMDVRKDKTEEEYPQKSPDNYGLRLDGTPKGKGFFGELKRPDGKVSTELSIGVNLNGKETQIPLIQPTLDQKEIDYLLDGNEPTDLMVNKAVEHAKTRMLDGKSPFADDFEVTPRVKKLFSSVEQSGNTDGDWLQLEPSTFKDLQERGKIDKNIDFKDIHKDQKLYDEVAQGYINDLRDTHGIDTPENAALWSFRPGYFKKYGGDIEKIPDDKVGSFGKSAKEVMRQRATWINEFKQPNLGKAKVKASGVRSLGRYRLRDDMFGGMLGGMVGSSTGIPGGQYIGERLGEKNLPYGEHPVVRALQAGFGRQVLAPMIRTPQYLLKVITSNYAQTPMGKLASPAFEKIRSNVLTRKLLQDIDLNKDNEIAQIIDKRSEAISMHRDRFGDKGLIKTFKEGGVQEATKWIGWSTLENAPYQLALLTMGVSQMSKIAGIMAMGVPASATQYYQSDIKDPNIKMLTGTMKGMVEGLFEGTIGTFGLARQWDKMLMKGAVNAVTRKEIWMNALQAPIAEAFGEGFEEVSTEIAQALIDQLIGGKKQDWGQVFENAVGAFAVGFASGGAMSGPTVIGASGVKSRQQAYVQEVTNTEFKKKQLKDDVKNIDEQIVGNRELSDVAVKELRVQKENKLKEIDSLKESLFKLDVVTEEDRVEWYSKMEQVVQSKMGSSMPAQDLTRMLLKNGVKPYELSAYGLDSFLQGKDKVTKQELQDHIDENRVTVKTVDKGQQERVLTPMEEKRLEYLEGLDAQAPLGGMDKFEAEGESGTYSEMLTYQNIRDKSTNEELLRLNQEFEKKAQQAQRSGDKRQADEYWQMANHYTARNEELQLSEPGEGGLIDDRKYGQYQVPGGENYREVLLQAPEMARQVEKDVGGTLADSDEQGRIPLKIRKTVTEKAPTYKSSHWDEPNVLAHIRMNDRIVNGKKVLFIEEIQSDWAKEGRDKGFQGNYDEQIDKMEKFAKENYKKDFDDLPEITQNELYAQFGIGYNETQTGVPYHPLLKKWQDLALKKVLRIVAEGGYDAIAWTTGEQQADRYDLSKKVKKVRWVVSDKMEGYGTLIVSAMDSTSPVINQQMGIDQIEKYIGKDVANKIINDNRVNIPYASIDIEGDGLKIGGEWAKNLYDKQIPNILKKLTKGEVGEVKIPTTDMVNSITGKTPTNWQTTQQVLMLTPAFKDSIMRKGQPLFVKMPVNVSQLKKSVQDITQKEEEYFEAVMSHKALLEEKQRVKGTTEKIKYTQKNNENYGMLKPEWRTNNPYASTPDVAMDIMNNAGYFFESIEGMVDYLNNLTEKTQDAFAIMREKRLDIDEKRLQKIDSNIDKQIQKSEVKAEWRGFKEGRKTEKMFSKKQLQEQKEISQEKIIDQKIVDQIHYGKKVADIKAKHRDMVIKQKEKNNRKNIEHKIQKLSAIDLPLDYQDKMDSLIGSYDLNRRSKKTKLGREKQSKFLEGVDSNNAIEMAMFPKDHFKGVGKTTLDEMSYQELEALKEKMDILVHVAKTHDKLLKSRKSKDYADYMRGVLTKIKKVTGIEFIDKGEDNVRISQRDNYSRIQKLKKTAQGLSAEHRKVEFIFDVLRISDDVFEPIIDGLREKSIVARNINNDLKDAYKSLNKEIDTLMHKQANIQGLDISITGEQAIGIALNSYNVDNVRRLVDGNKLNLTQIKIINDWVNSHPVYKKFVNDIFDIMDSQWQKTQEVSRTLTGTSPKKVEGKYFTIKYDPEKSKRIRESQAERDLMKEIYEEAFIERGYAKQRVGGYDPLDLNVLTWIPSHMDHVVHTNSMSVPVRDINKVINNPMFVDMIKEAFDSSVYRQIPEWLKDVANPVVLRDRNYAEKLATLMRKNATVFTLGGKLIVSMVQPLSYTLTAHQVGTVNAIKGLYNFYRHPMKMHKIIMEKSPFIRERYTEGVLDREIRDLFMDKRIRKLTKGSRDLEKMLYSGIMIMDYSAVMPTWLSAYDVKMNETNDEDMSIRYADKIVRKTQPTASVENMARVMKGNAYQKLFTSFMTHFSNVHNNLIEMKDNVVYAKDKTALQKMTDIFVGTTLIWTLPAILAALVRGQRKPEELLKAVATYPFAGMFMVRDLANLISNGFRYGAPPGLRALTETSKMLESHRILQKSKKEKTKKKWRIKTALGAVRAIGAATGKIPEQAVISAEGFIDLMSGETDDWRRLLFSKYYLRDTENKEQDKSEKKKYVLSKTKYGVGKKYGKKKYTAGR